MARWRIIVDGLQFKKNESKSVGWIEAEAATISPSGVLCFYANDQLVEAFAAHAWKMVSREKDKDVEKAPETRQDCAAVTERSAHE